MRTHEASEVSPSAGPADRPAVSRSLLREATGPAPGAGEMEPRGREAGVIGTQDGGGRRSRGTVEAPLGID